MFGFFRKVTVHCFSRGELNAIKDGIEAGTQRRSQAWNLDGLGNWSSFSTTAGGTTTTQARSHNQQNQLYLFSGSGVEKTSVFSLTRAISGPDDNKGIISRSSTIG